MKGGISFDMRLRYHKVIDFNEKDQTITVQTGMSGPKLEATLNRAQSLFNAKERILVVIFLSLLSIVL